MTHDDFRLADVSDEELAALYGEPVFFKTAEAELSAEVLAQLQADETRRIAEEQNFLAAADQRARHWSELEAKGQLTDAMRHEREQDERRRQEIDPHWLAWAERESELGHGESPEKRAERERPHLLAAFDNQIPFIVERAIGQGRVVFMASGMLSPWNTLPKTNAMLMVDRLLRGMLQNTLPTRNLMAVDAFVLPITERNASYSVVRPDGAEQPLSVDALGADLYGVTVRGALDRGVYKVIATKGDGSADASHAPAKLWETTFAVNGPGRESEPATLDEPALRQRVGEGLRYRWVGAGDAISVAGAHVSGQTMWKWLLAAVLGALLVEMAILAWPRSAREQTP